MLWMKPESPSGFTGDNHEKNLIQSDNQRQHTANKTSRYELTNHENVLLPWGRPCDMTESLWTAGHKPFHVHVAPSSASKVNDEH